MSEANKVPLFYRLLFLTPGNVPKWVLSKNCCAGLDLASVVTLVAGVSTALILQLGEWTWLAVPIFLFVIEWSILGPARKVERRHSKESS